MDAKEGPTPPLKRMTVRIGPIEPTAEDMRIFCPLIGRHGEDFCGKCTGRSSCPHGISVTPQHWN